jgi:Multicopper oxidase
MANIIRSMAAVSAVLAPLMNGVSALPLENEAAAPVELNERGLVFPIKVASSSSAVPVTSTQLAGKPAPTSGLILTGATLAGVALTAGQPVPSNVYNPNGPIYNPNDYTPLPFTWPGKPTAPGQNPPPRPSVAPFPVGGLKAASYQAPSWITTGLNSLLPALTQAFTNGNSYWGLLTCPTLPPWLGGNPPKPCSGMPTNGVTRVYDLTVSYQKIAPDGVVKNGITINGQFPGPLLEANWGDWYVQSQHRYSNQAYTSLGFKLLSTITSLMRVLPCIGMVCCKMEP